MKSENYIMEKAVRKYLFTFRSVFLILEKTFRKLFFISDGYFCLFMLVMVHEVNDWV